MKSLLLLSSDRRLRYAEDIQTVLAAPAGAVVQLRYLEKFVTPTVRRAVPSHQAEGLTAVVGFVGSAEPFLLPIRYATVAKAEYVADMIIFKLRVGGYVNLQQYPRSRADLVAMSRHLIGQLETDQAGVFYPATSNFPQLPEEVTDDVPERWLAAARRLAVHPTFEKSYFLRVAPVETQRGKALAFDEAGRMQAVDGQSLRLVTNIWSDHYDPEAEFTLTCTPDGTNLRPASNEVYRVALKYDVVEFWQFLTAQSFDTFSRVTIRLASEKAAPQTIPALVELPLVVSRSRSRMFRRWTAASAGAVLVALPAILGDGSPVGVRIGAALVGAGLLALSGAVLSGPK
ncbi:hypothetical protein ACWCOV_07020 [Kribbella sp. NPDC002412]